MALALAPAPTVTPAPAPVLAPTGAAGPVHGHVAVSRHPVRRASVDELDIVHIERGAGVPVGEVAGAVRPAAVGEEGLGEGSVLPALHLVRGAQAGAGGPHPAPRGEAHGAQRHLPGGPGRGAAAEDLLVGVAELAAEGHVDDEVDGGVERLQEVGDDGEGVVQVAVGAQAGVAGLDAGHNGVDGAGEGAQQEHQRHGQQHLGDAALLLPTPGVPAAPAHGPAHCPRAADSGGNEGVDHHHHHQGDEAEDDVEGHAVRHHEGVHAAQG